MGTSASERTRELLLDAAEELFGDNGFDGVSVREIAEQADASGALINYHFGGKAKLYEAVIERRLAQGKQIFESSTSLIETSSDMTLTREVVELTIRTVMRNFLHHVIARPSFVKLMTREVGAGFPVARKVVGRLMPMDPLTQFLERAQQAGVLRDDVPARYLGAVIFGIHQHFLASAPILREKAGIDPMDPDTMDRIIDMNLKILFQGIWSEEK